jgi:hypothetical protein
MLGVGFSIPEIAVRAARGGSPTPPDPDDPTSGVLAESGDFLVSEAGDFIVQE